MTTEEAAEIDEVRDSPLLWFQGFGRYRDEETRKPTRGRANVLQRRVAEHYRRCQQRNQPCRMAVLKYRRAGSSTIGSALVHVSAQNYDWRIGVIGTDYKASSNMLDMVKFFGEHDDFPGWSVKMKTSDTKISAEEWLGEGYSVAPLSERVDRMIATRIDYSHGSRIELYTSKNPESARSAGLNAYHATEAARWKNGGVQDAGETLTAMRNTLPKKGFHLALEESTANGAQGAFYETCRGARWPTDENGRTEEWARQWEAMWPLEEAEFGKELQFVFIFAAWFEDERHVPSEPLTERQIERLQETLDEKERELITRYEQDGPKGKRLGGEVNATTWEQLAWRRAIIKSVCTKGGADEFDVEYPSDPRTAFKASGAPALDSEGILALEDMTRGVEPEWGQVNEPMREGGPVLFTPMNRDQATVAIWERPFEGARYLVSCDPMSGADQVHGSGEKDRHSVLVLRDAYKNQRGEFHRVKVVARIRPPCEWEDEVVADQLFLLSRYYGGDGPGATIVVEGNIGKAILKKLFNVYGANVFQRPEIDTVTQRTTKKLGWWTDDSSRRILISALQHYVREQMLECCCPHIVGELGTLVIDARGKAKGSGGMHDDDPLALAMGLECLPAAETYPSRRPLHRTAGDEHLWRER